MSEAMEEIQRLTNEVERLSTVDADRERHLALYKEKVVEIEQQFDIAISERNRFNGSVNRLAEIVGLSGKQCYAPDAVERKAKLIAEEYSKSLDYAEFMNTQTKELNKQIEALESELHRLKKAAIDCDFHVLKCPVLAGEDLDCLDSINHRFERCEFIERLDPVEAPLEEQEGRKAEDHIVRNPGLNPGPVDEK